MKLVTANKWFKMSLQRYYHNMVAKALGRYDVPLQGVDHDSEPLVPFVNQGRWIVECPECKGGEYAWEEGFVFCFSCLNAGVKHKLRRVKFPENALDIEEALIVRPVANRNWEHGETIDDLERENDAHRDQLLIKGAN